MLKDYAKELMAGLSEDCSLYLDESLYNSIIEICMREKDRIPRYFWNVDFHFFDGEVRLSNFFIPAWLGVAFKTVAMKSSSLLDVLSLLHVNPTMNCEVVNYLDMVKEDYLPLQAYKLIRCPFSTPQESLRRALLLACLTFRLPKRNSFHERQ